MSTSSASNMSDIAEASNEFALALLKQLQLTGERNLIFSPSNIHVCLSMCCHGARNNTVEEMKKVLCMENFDDVSEVSSEYHKVIEMIDGHCASVELNIANRIFVEKTYKVLDTFQNDMQIYYKSSAEMLNFKEQWEKCRMLINKWIEDKTNKKIFDFLQPGTIGYFTKLVLVSAIYLKAKFEKQFKKCDTKFKEFFVSPLRKINVLTMQQEQHFQIGRDSSLNCRVLSMRYKGGDLDLVIILPDDKYGLEAVENKLNSKNLSEMLSSMSFKRVVLALPKFEYRFLFSVKQALVKMGLKDAFDENSADFSGIEAKPQPWNPYKLCISDVLHEAVVEVDEQGTEAVAATAVVMIKRDVCGYREFRPPPEYFTVDHPFLFIIRHLKTGVILFLGRVVRPNTKRPNTKSSPPANCDCLYSTCTTS